MSDNSTNELHRLRAVVSELACLNEIAAAISASMSVDTITEIIIDKSLKYTGASQGAVFLLEKDENKADLFKTYIRKSSGSHKDTAIHLNVNLTGWMIKHKKLLVINSPAEADQIGRVDLKSHGIRSLLAAPLLTRKGLAGLLVIFNKKDNNGFTNEDSRFLGILGSQCAQVIEAARLYEEEKRFMALNEELNLARSIQQSLLPSFSGVESGLPICGVNIPAREVGGDFFDIFPLDDNRTFVSIGDVVGKGVPAALLMSNTMAVQRSQLSSLDTVSLSDLTANINRTLCKFNKPGQFITALFGIYDDATGSFEYVSAGHHPPMVMKQNGVFSIDTNPDIVLGVLPHAAYSTHRFSLAENEALCLYTDGITEAFNEAGEEFGEQRLISLLWKEMNNAPRVIINRILTTLAEFRGKAAQSDDITIVIIKP